MTSATVELPSFPICPNPVFIIGSPRSGTSVLAWSLHHHPEFWTSHETEFLGRLFGHQSLTEAYAMGTSRPETWLRAHEVSRAEFLAHAGMGINALFTNRSGGKRWVDQTPGYTSIVDLLADIFPGARFLHIVRDGRSVVRSMMHFHESVGQGLRDAGTLPEWARSFELAVSTWRQFVLNAASFCERCPDRGLTIVNEKLVDHPEKEFARIFEFLESPADIGAVNFFRSSRINSSFQPLQWGSTASLTATRMEMPPSSAEAAWSEWTSSQKAHFIKEAGELMESFGFMS